MNPSNLLTSNNIPGQYELNSKYLREMQEKKQKNQNNNSNTFRMNTNFKQLEPNVQFNTNIQDYSTDDIFEILDIKLDKIESYAELKEKINEKVDKAVGIFENLKNTDMVNFFQNIRSSLLGQYNDNFDNLTEAEKLLLIFDDKFNAEKNRGIISNNTDTTNNNLYDNSKGAYRDVKEHQDGALQIRA
mgnify:CR=1 FL=1